MSTAIRRATLTALLVSVSAGLPGAQPPQTAWRPSSDTRVSLTFHANAAGTKGTYTNLLTAGGPLARDYWGLALTPGFGESGDLCTGSVTVSASPADATSGAASWFIETRLVSLEQDQATIDLRWTRHVNRTDLSPNETVTSEQRLVLHDGDHGILDLVRTAPSSDGCDSFGITYDLRLDGPRELADAALGYDLWLVQQDGDGQVVTERFQSTAMQSEHVNYFFPPLRYRKDGSRVSRGSDILMSVRGLVSGRLRSDGDIDLTVEGERGFSASGGSVSARGRTLVTVRPGETIEVPLDLPLGSLANFGSLAPMFGAHHTSLRITAHRRW